MASSQAVGQQARSSAKETVTSIFIAFVMAFVFRGFVVEAFVIPTGSMAPTLMGAHVRFNNPETGYAWPVNYSVRDERNYNRKTGTPYSVQRDLTLVDPITRESFRVSQSPLLWGDRIFVMKYLVGVNTPRRWDSIVFKNPNDPPQSYIKRLIGLPGEQVALVDGDVFVRTPQANDPKVTSEWALPGWKAARKPEMAQRAMWQLVFDSQFSPLNPVKDGRRWFSPPWAGADAGGSAAGWTLGDDGVYAYSGAGATQLLWKSGERAIDDWYAYDVETYSPAERFPVSDVRMSMGVEPASAGLRVSGVLTARGHNYRLEVEGSKVVVRMRAQQVDEVGSAEAWVTLAEGTLAAPLAPGVVTNIDFWHVDQSVQVWVNDRLVASGEYDWTIGERVQHSLNLPLEAVEAGEEALIRPAQYVKPQVRWEFSGGGFRLHRAALWRDIFYQPCLYDYMSPTQLHPNEGEPGLATHPRSPLQLSGAQYFVCGDNSPASLDARKWGPPHPWVGRVDDTTGVVNSDLVLGRAFFVYFPAPNRVMGLPVPDVGRMRWIW